MISYLHLYIIRQIKKWAENRKIEYQKSVLMKVVTKDGKTSFFDASEGH
jgi:hypothetical protein